ncbi:MAG: SLBB domain-containing protein [Treponema sp.]|jgi:protein involved in polysaccharide export with SLBB domain|nr:SLBB domain-containing protein [Treponema sp.]
MKRRVWVLVLWLITWPNYVFSQEVSEAQEDLQLSLSPSAQLALSTPDYRVTAGDVYTLAYLAGARAVEYTITVDSTYRIRVSNLGIIDGAGKTYNQLKAQVESIVSNNYPLGGVQFVLKQPAAFKVYLRGEVKTTAELSTWALARVGSIIGPHLTPYSSTRNITIRSANGQARVYDLYRANRMGDLSQNPYVRPDDIIIINRLERRVTIGGAVERPGTYQLLPGENLKQLIEVYANGFTALADKTRIAMTRYVDSTEISGDRILLSEQDVKDNYKLQNYDSISIPSISDARPVVPVNRIERTITISGAVRRPGTYELMPNENLKELVEVYGDGFTAIADTGRIELVRLVDSSSKSGDKIPLSEQDIADNFVLRHYDVITVPDITSLRPVIFVEGAVGIGAAEGEEAATPESSTRFTVPFTRGEYYGVLIRRNRGWFSAVSDTRNAYIIRGAEYIPVNLNPMLYDENFRGDQVIMENDTLIVPFRQYFITVAGAVVNPGRYPYIPDRSWDYYVALSGGFVPGRNKREAVDIVDVMGRKLSKTDIITPETIITARTNDFLFTWNQYAPVVTGVLSIVTTLITVVLLVTR